MPVRFHSSPDLVEHDCNYQHPGCWDQVLTKPQMCYSRAEPLSFKCGTPGWTTTTKYIYGIFKFIENTKPLKGMQG